MASQFLLLLWKNWTLQKRKKCVTVFEILMPVSFALLLVLIRSLVKRENIDHITTFPPLDAAGVKFDIRILEKPMLLYTPKDAVINNIMNDTLQFLPDQPTINGSIPTPWTLVPFDNIDDLLNFYQLYYKNVWAAVQFDTSSNGATLSKNVHYSLRVSPKDSDSTWRTDNTYPFFQSPGYRNDEADGGTPDYYTTGFLALQVAVDKAITLHFNASARFDDIDLKIEKMPYPPFIKDNFLTVLQQNFPLLLVLGFILAALQTTKSIVYEKEKKLKEAMKLMGMNSFLYWVSWFIKDLIYLVIVIALYTVLFKISIGEKGKILPNSDASLMFVFLLCYILSILAFCFMVSTFFNKANAGAFAGGALFYAFYIPYYFLQSRYETMSRGEKMGTCILNNMGMAFGLNTVGLYEGTGEGARWTNFHKPATVDDNFSLLDAMLMLIIDTVVYFLITWYVDGVHPGEYGVPLPWYFPFSKTYWCGQPRSRRSGSFAATSQNENNFERDPTGLEVGISISNLRKVFGSGKKKKIAVANTSINMYEGQITALLGHNGAGKTTTMSMLTGFLPSTSGTANVNGYDIVDNITGVRKSLGLCPQHNILFDTMTVEEHLYFYAKLKGCPTNQVQKEIDDMIKVLDLEAKRHRFSMTLSGGQKRKLSVGIALIAGSKIVILDEPTSGMDPAARRQTWDILQSFKKERTLVLSTHFMDEADLLGDRIAIMAEGVVKCCGSSLFLKKLYGAGYHLIIVKGKDCDVGKLTSLIQSHIATAEIESEISAELSYLLPFNETAKFENMFLDIENKSQELGITSFGTSATTMEEVFLKVGDANVEEEEEMNDVSVDGIPNPNYGSTFDNSKNGDLSASAKGIPNGKTQTEDISLNLKDHESYIGFNSVVTKNVGLILTYQQFCGMFMKKLLHTWRNRTVTLVQTILPVLFVIMALTVEKTLPKVKDDPALPLDLHMFDDVKVIVNTGINATTMSQTLGDQYSNVLKKDDHQIVKYPSSQYDNISQYLLETSKQVGLNVFKKQYILAGDFEPVSDTQVNATAVFNGEPFHAVAISLTYMLDSMLKYFTDDSHSISTTNFPFPRPIEDSSRGFGYATRGTGFSIAFTVLFGMAFLSTSFIIFLIKERSTGAKHLQKVSGVSAMSYWFSNFVWDLINYIVPVLLILICFAAFQTDAYTDDSRLGLIFLCFMLYGWACLPSVYIFHYLFKTPASGMVMVSLLNIVTGLATMMAVFIIEIPDLDIPEVVGTSLDWIFTIFLPNHCLGQSLLYIYTNYGYKEVCITAQYEMACGNPNITYHPCCRDKCTSNCFFFEDNYLSLTTPGSGRYVLFMAAQGFLYFTVVFMIEYGIFERIFYSCKSTTSHSVASLSRQQSMYDPDNEDSDVQDEKKRINDSDLQRLLHTDSIVLKDLCKNYDHFRAVKGVSVGIPKQECFGLLGQNGAGKTSVFKMLTGDQMVTSGNAYLNAYDVQQHMIQVQQNIGYCPQFDALIDQMTGRETLTMYARLRGVKENLIKNVVNELLDIMMLRKYADRQCGTYSGGNKRKLSTAIALVGDPPFILLDEPTTGMDPAARRKLWNVLSQIRASGRTLILTSHSMEECDALCTKIAIMVNGRFVCLGSSQHLKNKYGHGYTLIVRIGIDENGMPAHTEPLKEFITSTFPDSQIFDDHQGYLHFQIPDASIPLASVFGAMEKAKERLNIEDYSVHQTTLEQVFLTFTKNQHPPKEDKKGFFSSLVCCR